MNVSLRMRMERVPLTSMPRYEPDTESVKSYFDTQTEDGSATLGDVMKSQMFGSQAPAEDATEASAEAAPGEEVAEPEAPEEPKETSATSEEAAAPEATAEAGEASGDSDTESTSDEDDDSKQS